VVGWKMTLEQLALRMRCSRCVPSLRWAAVQRYAFDAPLHAPTLPTMMQPRTGQPADRVIKEQGVIAAPQHLERRISQ